MTLPIQGIPVTVVSNGKAGGAIHRLGDTNTCGNRNDTGTPLNIFLN